MKAFSLVELLVVAAVVAILTAIFFPLLLQEREKFSHRKCAENLRQFGAAFHLYLAEHEQRMPEIVDLRSSVLSPYLQNEQSTLFCPSDSRTPQHVEPSYRWNAALNGQSLSSLKFQLGAYRFEKLSDIPVMSEAGDWHAKEKKNFLYADGSVGNHALAPMIEPK